MKDLNTATLVEKKPFSIFNWFCSQKKKQIIPDVDEFKKMVLSPVIDVEVSPDPLAKRCPLLLPRDDLFIEMFPYVSLANLKQEQIIKNLDTQFVDKSTGNVYAYNDVDGWKKMIGDFDDDEEDTSPPDLKERFPAVTFREVIPGVQYKDSCGNVYGKFEQEGWKIIPKTKYLRKITTG